MFTRFLPSRTLHRPLVIRRTIASSPAQWVHSPTMLRTASLNASHIMKNCLLHNGAEKNTVILHDRRSELRYTGTLWVDKF